MFTIYKRYIGSFFIVLWAITHMLQLGHEVSHLMLTHHNDGCSHHHHEVKKLDNQPILVLEGENWHEGVIGIVAARITGGKKNDFYRLLLKHADHR